METLKFRTNPIRMIYEDGVRWFSLRDICGVLGIKNQAHLLRNIPPEDVKRLGLISDNCAATKHEQKMLMVGQYAIDDFLKRSYKPLAPDIRAWLASLWHTDHRVNQKDEFQEQVNVYDFTDVDYGLRMAAKILGLHQNTFAPWVTENFFEPDKHTPKEKHAHLFHVKMIVDANKRPRYQIFLTDDAYTFFNRPANRMTLPAPDVIPWDPKFPDEISD